jgi:small subunit ribosomal protein S16
MAVRIRMTRLGRTNRPFYRIGTYDARSPRDGRCLENLGWYNPIANNVDDQLKLNIQRVEHWISVGALPTPKVYFLLKKAGVRLHKEPVKKAEKKETAEAKAEVKAEVKNKKKVRTHNKKMKK